MELTVWEIPTDVSDRPELNALFECCENLWQEHVYSRLAVPEVLEHQDQIKSFDDIEMKIMRKDFPFKNMFLTPPKQSHHRRFVSFQWAKLRPRRDKSKPEWTMLDEATKMREGWLTYNTRRSTTLLPANSILVAMWMTEWDIPRRQALTLLSLCKSRTNTSDTDLYTLLRSILLSSMLMFDHLGFDDRVVLHCGEQVRKVLREIIKHNSDHPDDRWEVPEHFWTLYQDNPVSAYQPHHYFSPNLTFSRLPLLITPFCWMKQLRTSASPTVFVASASNRSKSTSSGTIAPRPRSSRATRAASRRASLTGWPVRRASSR